MRLRHTITAALLCVVLTGCGHAAKETVYFSSGSDQLSAKSKQAISKAVKTAKEDGKDIRRIKLTGFTDTVGNIDYNKTLAKKRLASVRKALVSKGVDSDKVTSKSYGEGYKDSDLGGDKSKRKVEITIY